MASFLYDGRSAAPPAYSDLGVYRLGDLDRRETL